MRSATLQWRLLLALCAALPLAVQAGLSLSDTPLFLTSSTTSNVVLTIDDSGSMERGYVPDSLGDSTSKLNSALFTASSYNALYYNPRVSYAIPTRTDGVSYSTSFTAAYVNGFDTSKGSTNLSTSPYLPIYRCTPDTSAGSCSKTTGSGTTTTSTTVTRTYTGCTVTFDDRGGKNKDRISVSNCTPAMPATGDGSPVEADISTITVSNTSNNNGSYTVSSSSSKDGGVRIDLNTTNQITTDRTVNNVTFTWTETNTTTSSPAAAYYHLYYTDKAGASRPTSCTNSVDDKNCYLPVVVGSADDIAIGGGDAAARKQNFANWYSFYRTRALATMSAAMNAVTSLGINQVRLGWQTLNNGGCTSFGTSCKGYDGVSRENRIRTLDAFKDGSTTVTHRTDFYNWISRLDVGGGTPLRSAMQRAGEYFTLSGRDSPYAQEPYVNEGTVLSCRRNFHVLMTDGLWNSDSGVNFGGNVDSTNKTLPDGTSYTARYPYRNPSTSPPSGMSYSNSLADIAFKYWSTDLRSNLSNNLGPYVVDRSGSSTDQFWNPRNNPATWQHMVNYTISFGLGSVLTDPAWGGSTFSGDYSALANGTKTWPAVDESPSGDPEEHVYDLWHAAINSRGQFFNADDPVAISNAFKSVFSAILAANPSSAALAANSTSIQTGTLIYQAKFDSRDWHGQLVAYNVNLDGSIGTTAWDAASKLPAASSRKVTTSTGTLGKDQGKDFKTCSSDLTDTQKTLLNKTPSNVVDNKCQDRLDWLRGDRSKEVANGGTYRSRVTTVLGDTINSDPVYVKNEDYGYAGSAIAGASSYAAFVAGKASRIPMVYVGANDGMLHGFRADTGSSDSGRELMAHVPNAVFSKINQLMDPGYTHTFFVDGSPTVGDAYLSNTWKTVLVSGLGAGGKGVFALDVTDPTNHGPSKVLWEFSDTDLGYTFSQPQIGRLKSGQWVAIFGNGYNSAVSNEKAFLYVVNLETGAQIAKIQAGSTASTNGLSTPALIDTNNDKFIDYAYAGDLQGNLWKFDLTSETVSSWTVAKLFEAKNASNEVQPITVKPALSQPTSQPSGGVMVLFGTGKYLSSTDPSSTQVQSFYAIWDNGAGVATRSQLQAQTIQAETNEFGYTLRQTSNNTVDYLTKRGWYLDLVVSGESGVGERVVSNAIVRYDRVIFVTTLPSADVCQPGGGSWLMELEAYTGSRTSVSVFNFNGDTFFNASDKLTSGATASGVKSTVGIIKTPAWLEQGRASEFAVKEMSGSSGGIFSLQNRKPAVAGSVKRVFWQQIQ
jgi:type IV pilus assembly protein PilY1